MADYESLEEYLFITPQNAGELLNADLSRLDKDADIESVAVHCIDGDPLVVAMAAMAEARMIIDTATSEQFTADLASTDLDEATRARLTGAISRRDAAKGLLTEASERYDTEYSKERTTTSEWNGGKVLIERDTDKVLDLYDQTEVNDNHPVLVLIEKVRASLGKNFAIINDADVVLRIAFAGEVELLPVLEAPTPEDTDSPQTEPTTSSSAGAA